MRDSTAIRNNLIEQLDSMLKRPGMYGDGLSVELLLDQVLGQLSFIDERETAASDERERLRSEGLCNAMGIRGALMASCGVREDVLPEFVALVGARSAARMGYVLPSHRVEEAAFRRFVSDEEAIEVEHLDDLVSELGPPLKKVTEWTRICGWAGPTEDQWIAAGVDARRALEFVMVLGSNGGVMRRTDETAEAIAAYRRFLVASLRGNEAELRPMLIKRPDPAVLWEGAYPADVAAALGALWESTDVMQVSAPDDGIWLLSDACPVSLKLVRQQGEWRVDAEPLMRMRPPPARQ